MGRLTVTLFSDGYDAVVEWKLRLGPVAATLEVLEILQDIAIDHGCVHVEVGAAHCCRLDIARCTIAKAAARDNVRALLASLRATSDTAAIQANVHRVEEADVQEMGGLAPLRGVPLKKVALVHTFLFSLRISFFMEL